MVKNGCFQKMVGMKKNSNNSVRVSHIFFLIQPKFLSLISVFSVLLPLRDLFRNTPASKNGSKKETTLKTKCSDDVRKVMCTVLYAYNDDVIHLPRLWARIQAFFSLLRHKHKVWATEKSSILGRSKNPFHLCSSLSYTVRLPIDGRTVAPLKEKEDLMHGHLSLAKL